MTETGRRQTYGCALCGGSITTADSVAGRLVTVNIDGHAKAAHRDCPPADDASRQSSAEGHGRATSPTP